MVAILVGPRYVRYGHQQMALEDFASCTARTVIPFYASVLGAGSSLDQICLEVHREKKLEKRPPSRYAWDKRPQ